MKTRAQIKTWHKLTAIIVGLLVPICVLLWMLIDEKNAAIHQAQQELRGAEYVKALLNTQKAAAEHRGISNALRNGATHLRSKTAQKLSTLEESLQALQIVQQRHGESLTTEALYEEFETALHSARAEKESAKRFAADTRTIGKLIDLVTHVGKSSHLIREPESGALHLIETTVKHLPGLFEIMGRMRGKLSGVAAKKLPTDEDTKLWAAQGIIEVRLRLKGASANTRSAIASDESLASLTTLLGTFDDAVSGFGETTDTEFLKKDTATVDAGDYFTAGTTALARAFELYDGAHQAMTSRIQTRAERLQSAKSSLVIGIMVCVALALGLAAWITRGLAKSIATSVRVAEEMTNGNYDIKVEKHARDETGLVSEALENMQTKIKTLVARLDQSSTCVSDESRDLASGLDELLTVGERAAESIEETCAATEEISANISSNADNARRAQEKTSAAVRLADQGREAVSSSMKSIEAISKASKKVVEIVDLVNDIAFQTNMLALNAAVEAARAGAHGKGFAVVAVEVRRLSARSAEAATQIHELVTSVVKTVDAGSTSVQSSGKLLVEIAESVNEIAHQAEEMAAASEEQASGIHEINAAISEMTALVERTNAMVDQTTQTATSLDAQSADLRSAVVELSSPSQQAAKPVAAAEAPAS